MSFCCFFKREEMIVCLHADRKDLTERKTDYAGKKGENCWSMFLRHVIQTLKMSLNIIEEDQLKKED